MWLLFPLIALTYYLLGNTPSDLSELLISLSQFLHNFCLSFSKASPYQGLYQSLSCGVKLPQSLYPLFASSGLIHLIIISGLHISLLYRLLSFAQKKIKFLPRSLNAVFSLTILFFYTLMLNVSAPALRAYCFQIIQLTNKKCKLHWPPSYLILISVLLSLLWKPALWTSLSLLLSWLAILVIYLVQQTLAHPLIPKIYKQIVIKKIIQSLLLYLFLFPILSQFNSLHPFSIFVQLLFTPLLLFILIPLSIVQYFLFFNTFFVDYLWNIFFLFLEPLQNFLQNEYLSQKHSLIYFWIYVVSVQFILMLLEGYIRRFKLSMKKTFHRINHDL